MEHATVHTTAVVHPYYGGEDTNHFLPPESTSSYPDRPGGASASAIASGWVVLVGAVLGALNRRGICEPVQRTAGPFYRSGSSTTEVPLVHDQPRPPTGW